VRCRLRVEPGGFEGWGVFRPASMTRARLVRPARMAERRSYLDLFARARLVLCRQERDGWLGIAAQGGDQRFAVEGLAPVHLVEGGQLFEIVTARFDGARLWFDAVDEAGGDPGVAAYLRESLAAMAAPDGLSRKGLTREQRHAYEINYEARARARERDARQEGEHRLRGALRHAGADLRDFADAGDAYRVSFEVDGRRHTSVIRKRDLTVQAAGICLSGQDASFDLQSLVGVLRESQGRGMRWT
jgi:hypothetical protein